MKNLKIPDRFTIFISVLILIILVLPASRANALVYEASDLHNTVSRSDTVQKLFLERWETILEDSLYFDLYGKINWLQGFKVNAFNKGTGKTEATDMTLVRTYGSFTINFPILGNNYFSELKSRLSFDRESKLNTEEEEEEESGLPKYWDKKNLLIGFTTTGFHYGLTRKIYIDRGTAGEETATDYKFSQFFDDIYAFSIVFVPYIYLHCGWVINNMIEPDDNGTIDYADSSNKETRFFFASNVFSFFNTGASVKDNDIESIEISVKCNMLINVFYQLPEYVPDFTIGYKRIKLYGDQPYDSVWVDTYFIYDSAQQKNSDMPNSEKEKSSLNLFSLLLEKKFKNILLTSFYIEFQKTDKPIIDKRNLKTIHVKPVKDMQATAGINLLGFTSAKLHILTLTGGWSRYWDPGVAVHRESGLQYSIDGWMFRFEYCMPLGGLYFMINRNYSTELRKLVEATDKLGIEGGLSFKL